MNLWKYYLIGFGIYVVIVGSITASISPASYFGYYFGTAIGEYLLYSSFGFVIYWGIKKFLKNKILSIIIAVIPVIFLRLFMLSVSSSSFFQP
ncbi:MAG: hypothetical protein O3C48_08255 [Crenarchaeota archaeon]|nr:hypothetical protein [Thermoproteota archaeon]